MIDTRIKICGITSPDDAQMCYSLGADYLGLIFAESSRQIDRETAKQIRVAVPNAMLVGVFLDAPIEEIIETGKAAQLNMIQLHGSEPPEYCEEVGRRLSLPVIKTFSMSQLAGVNRVGDYRRTSYFLFDLDKNDQAPDLSRDHLWSEAAKLRRIGYRVFLAGALDSKNVRDALRHVEPYGIDVASGVEINPGVKDRAAVLQFIQEVRR